MKDERDEWDEWDEWDRWDRWGEMLGGKQVVFSWRICQTFIINRLVDRCFAPRIAKAGRGNPDFADCMDRVDWMDWAK